MNDFDKIRSFFANGGEARTLTRKQVRDLDTEDQDALEALDFAQGDAGDDGIAVIIVTGEPL